MENINKSYIINKLNTGANLNIIFMSHNAYWPYLEQLAMYYKNCKVQVFGKGTAYLKMSLNNMPMNDCDLINLYATNYDEFELIQMKMMAHRISREKNKVVTIGYSYIIPSNQIIGNNREYEIKFVRISESVEDEDIITNVTNLTPLELTELTLIKHDGLEKQKIRKKS